MASGKSKVCYSKEKMSRVLELITEAEVNLISFNSAVAQLDSTEGRSIDSMSELNVNSYRTEKEEKEDGFSLDSLGNQIKKYVTIIFYFAVCAATRCSTPGQAMALQRAFNSAKISRFKGILRDVYNEGVETHDTIKKDVADLKTAFKGIKSSIEHFENGDIGLYEELVESGEYNDYSTSAIVVDTNVNGVENVESIILLSDEAKDLIDKANIEELIGSGKAIQAKDTLKVLFSKSKTGISAMVAVELYCEKNNITGEDKQNIAIRAVNQSFDFIDEAYEKGYFNYTTKAEMAQVIREELGIEDVTEDNIASIIEGEYKSIIEEKTGMSYEEFEDIVSDVSDIYGTNSFVSESAGLFLGLAATGAVSGLGDKFTEEEKDAINEAKEAAGVEITDIKDVEIGKKENYETVNADRFLSSAEPGIENAENIPSGEEEIVEQSPLTETDSLPEQGVSDPLHTEDPKDNLPAVDDNPPQTISDDVAKGIENKMDELADADTPDNIEHEKASSQEIDNQARDEYYASKSNDKLLEDRNKAMDDFANMSPEVKVKALEGMGYTTTVAAALAADQVKGQAAYIRGLEEHQIAMMSNDLASQQGIANHNTAYDDGHDMSYVESGQVNKDLTPTSQKVQSARQNLTTAKNNYDDSVTNANESIDKAKKAKNKYDRTLKAIKESSGDDPKKWTTDQINDYNNAAKEYNEAIVDVNKAVQEVDSKKAVYESEKNNYNSACEEYRKEAAVEYEKSQENNILNEITDESDKNLFEISDDVFKEAISGGEHTENKGTITDVQNVSDGTSLTDDGIVISENDTTYIE